MLGEALRLLMDVPDSEPKSSLFLSKRADPMPRLLHLDESDSDSRPSESSWPLSTLDWESDLWNEGPDLSEKECYRKKISTVQRQTVSTEE